MDLLDQYVQRLQNIPTFNIHAIDAKGDHAPWYEVTSDVVQDLVIRQQTLTEQVELIGAQIMFWGRMEAQAKRVWEIEERGYRIWRDTQYLLIVDAAEKKPTEKNIDAQIRSNKNYLEWQKKIERAEESFNAAHAVLEGFRAKKDMLRAHVFRAQEGAAPRLSV